MKHKPFWIAYACRFSDPRNKLPHLRVIYVFPCQAQFQQAECSPEAKQPWMVAGRRNHPAVSNTSNPTWPSKTQSDDDHCVDKSNRWGNLSETVLATLLPSATGVWNDSLVPAVVVCGYENRPRRIFEKKGHRREQIIKILPNGRSGMSVSQNNDNTNGNG